MRGNGERKERVRKERESEKREKRWSEKRGRERELFLNTILPPLPSFLASPPSLPHAAAVLSLSSRLHASNKRPAPSVNPSSDSLMEDALQGSVYSNSALLGLSVTAAQTRHQQTAPERKIEFLRRTLRYAAGEVLPFSETLLSTLSHSPECSCVPLPVLNQSLILPPAPHHLPPWFDKPLKGELTEP